MWMWEVGTGHLNFAYHIPITPFNQGMLMSCLRKRFMVMFGVLSLFFCVFKDRACTC